MFAAVRRTPIALAALVALVGVAALVPATSQATGFRFGVGAGEITPDAARIWTRANDTGSVRAQIAKDRDFDKVVARRLLEATADNDATAQSTFRDLRTDMRYFYRFCDGERCRDGGRSEKGTFRTAPGRADAQTIRFGVIGDADGTAPGPGQDPFFGDFRVYETMEAENNHFNVNMGDTIYSDSSVDGQPASTTVPEKWAKYRQNLGIDNLREFRGSTGFYSHWDDHEFINDFTIPEHGRELFRNGVQAFKDYAPVSYSSEDGLYRRFTWGSNLEVFFLDERSFRSGKASANGTCDNPQTNDPDLAPTAPQSVRDVFAALVPSLSQPVSQQCKNKINNPDRTLLGDRQRTRFLNEVESSDARWKIVMNETPLQQFYALPYDRWEGYAHERLQLLNGLQRRQVENLLFITTDTHAAFANEIYERTLANDVAPENAPNNAPVATPYNDYVIGPVGTNTFWEEIDQVTGDEGNGELISAAFFKPPPPNGMGMECAQGDVFSYAEVTVTATAVTVEYLDRNGDPVLDVNGAPCGPFVIPGS